MRTLRVAVIVAALIGLGAALLHMVAYDGLLGLVLPPLLGEDTEYAPGYREASFRTLLPGTKAADIRALLGEPLDRKMLPGGREIWWYSRSPSGTHYHHRFVIIDSRGVCVKVGHEFYVD